MSATVAISQLSSLAWDLEAWIVGLNDILYTEDELSVLDVLGAKLENIVTIIQKKTGLYRLPCEDQAWTASTKLRSYAWSAILSLTNYSKLDRSAVFRRNIALIFAGPKDLEFDSMDIRSRKLATR
jgi:hypothetical protein